MVGGARGIGVRAGTGAGHTRARADYTQFIEYSVGRFPAYIRQALVGARGGDSPINLFIGY